VNRDPFPHTATSAKFDSKDIAPGASWTFTAKAPGELPYVCTLHPTMKGTLRVTTR
jgi:plastocyanin